MKLTTLVENNALPGFVPKHGLSFYVETGKHKILFDLGPDDTLIQNAKKAGIDLSAVDTVVISHGHKDHGGALRNFLVVNNTAKIYVQSQAFARHTAKLFGIHTDVGLDRTLITHPQVILVDGDHTIDEELSLFTVSDNGRCYSEANNPLYEEKQKDPFSHEQNLVIRGASTVVLVGCGHNGIVNIMEKAKAYAPDACIGGYHLYNPLNRRTAGSVLLQEIASELKQYPNTDFYTCHCTGGKAYQDLKAILPGLSYLQCGSSVEI